MRVLFISDLHLNEDSPAAVRAFFAFLEGPAQTANALYILGDLFEYWAGDDDDTPLARQIATALTVLAKNGVRIFFMAGNRDFLLGADYARDASLERLPDPTLLALDDSRVLISHGDMLCTDDTAYQTYRSQVRESQWQQAFLARPLTERKQIIHGLRQRSIAAKQEKAAEIMDVNDSAVTALLREYDYPVLVHGHTHRPARHLHNVDGRQCERWVLSDWHDHAPYLEWEGGIIRPRRFHP